VANGKPFSLTVEMRAMSDVDLTTEQYEKHREAGDILAKVRAEAVDRVEVGASHLAVAEWVEERIRELGGEPAFPVNISIDEEAAHATPGADDDATFGEEMVNVDIGVHVDGWLADSAITVDLSGNPELVEASAEALDAALDVIEAGVSTSDIGAVVEDVIEGYGYNPVVNLTGHGLGHWEQHTEPNIPNRAVTQGVELEAGDVVAIEPFATDGGGKVSEGSEEEIFALEREASVRDRGARQALEQITDQFRTLPFATRWLDVSRPSMALRRLKRQDIVHGYPVLKEDEGNLVSQKEHTVIVTEDGCEVTTR
jgi:methionyl aminopeptidase